MANLEFTDEELEHYFSLQSRAEEYMNMLIRLKRIELMPKEYRGEVKNDQQH